jgi:transposase
MLLAAEQRLTAAAISAIVCKSEETVRQWLKRYKGEGVAGLHDQHQGVRPATVTDTYREQLLYAVRRRPRILDQPYSLWTLQRLADYLAEQTGIRIGYETVTAESTHDTLWSQTERTCRTSHSRCTHSAHMMPTLVPQ